MRCTCRVCGNDFEYTINGVGYDRNLCGPICDGIEAGRKSQDRGIEELERRLLAGCRLATQDGKWCLFSANGDGITSGLHLIDLIQALSKS